jgi:hypothetical protein
MTYSTCQRCARAAALLVLSTVVASAPAAAQSSPGRYELSIGAVMMGPMPIGERDATLTRPTGAPLVLFNSDITVGAGPGAEIHFGRGLGPRLALEATGTWAFTKIHTRASSDFENATEATLTEDLSRFSIEGSALWRVAGGAARALLLRGGAGWMRELTPGATLAENGVIGNVGAAVKYWWGTSSSTRGRRLGLRLDGRAVLRAGGIDLGAEGVRVAPAAAADLMFGF